MEKQMKLVEESMETKKKKEEEISIMKSAFQKYVRRGNYRKAMYWALKLAEENWWMFWHRATIIAQEDCLSAETVTAVGELYRSFMQQKKGQKEEGLTWDMKRTVVATAYLLATSVKNRIADEFLELMDAIDKNKEDAELQAIEDELETLDDYVFDCHTLRGKKMGRGNEYWYKESSKVEGNLDANYREWKDEFRKIMLRIEGEKR